MKIDQHIFFNKTIANHFKRKSTRKFKNVKGQIFVLNIYIKIKKIYVCYNI